MDDFRALPDEAVMVYGNDDEIDELCVYAWADFWNPAAPDGGLVWLQQGPDLVSIPVDQWERVASVVMGIVVGRRIEQSEQVPA